MHRSFLLPCVVVFGLLCPARAGDLDFHSLVDRLSFSVQGGVGFPSRNPQLDALPGFQHPPPGYGEVPFWWWTGDPLDKERLLANGDRWERDIAKRIAMDAPYR